MVVILLLPPTNGCDDNNNNNDNVNASASARNNHTTEHIYYPRKSQNATINPSILSNKNFIRHVTRVNISDIYSQVEIDGDAEPVTKEGECSNLDYTFVSTSFLLPLIWRFSKPIYLRIGHIILKSISY